MICVPVPDRNRELRPSGQTRVFLPPDRDMTNEHIRAAEVMLDMSQIGPCIRMYWQLEPGDLEKLQLNEGIVEVTIFGNKLPPIDAQIY